MKETTMTADEIAALIPAEVVDHAKDALLRVPQADPMRAAIATAIARWPGVKVQRAMSRKLLETGGELPMVLILPLPQEPQS